MAIGPEQPMVSVPADNRRGVVTEAMAGPMMVVQSAMT